MSGQISFFAAAEDDVALREYARGIGLTLVPAEWASSSGVPDPSNPQEFRLCGLSVVPIEALHPVEVLPRGSGKVRVGWATDPIIEFQRSATIEDAVFAGRLWWSDSPRHLASQTKPFFEKLRKWVGRNWSRRENDKYFIGPDACRLATEGYELLYLPKNIRVIPKSV